MDINESIINKLQKDYDDIASKNTLLKREVKGFIDAVKRLKEAEKKGECKIDPFVTGWIKARLYSAMDTLWSISGEDNGTV
jgi:hypothetical protein